MTFVRLGEKNGRLPVGWCKVEMLFLGLNRFTRFEIWFWVERVASCRQFSCLQNQEDVLFIFVVLFPVNALVIWIFPMANIWLECIID